MFLEFILNIHIGGSHYPYVFSIFICFQTETNNTSPFTINLPIDENVTNCKAQATLMFFNLHLLPN